MTSSKPSSSQYNWGDYYQKTQQALPHETCKQGAALVKEQSIQYPKVLDLGCGGGRDLFYLLSQGFTVLAVDSAPAAKEAIESNLPPDTDGLEIQISAMEELQIQSGSIHFINASASLPFLNAESFSNVWPRIEQWLVPGGLFAGHFFGIKDTWQSNVNMNFHSAADVAELVRSFEIIQLKEQEYDAPSAADAMKHWHRFDLVLRKSAF